MSGFEEFKRELGKAASLLRRYNNALLIHHDDADGLCSAAILVSSLRRVGLEVETVCVEKLFKEVLDLIHSKSYDLFIYADIGSPHAPSIAERVGGERKAIILDHHNPKRTSSDNVINLNPEFFNLSGERDASGATVAYLLSKELIGLTDGKLASLAVIGSAEIPGAISGLNREALEDAIRDNRAKVVRKGRSVDYLVNLEGSWTSYRTLSKELTVIGSVGFYRGGPLKALRALTEGGYASLRSEIKTLEELRRRKLKEVIRLLNKGGLKRFKHVQWLHVGDLLRGLGSKTIGTIASYISFRPSLIDPSKYLLASMDYEKTIPQLGSIKGDYSKFSARAPTPLRDKIAEGRAPPIASLLEEVAEQVGGFFDGHDYAASGLIPKGLEEGFVRAADDAIAKELNRSWKRGA